MCVIPSPDLPLSFISLESHKDWGAKLLPNTHSSCCNWAFLDEEAWAAKMSQFGTVIILYSQIQEIEAKQLSTLLCVPNLVSSKCIFHPFLYTRKMA